MFKAAFDKIDNSSLIIFRIFFGVIFFSEAVGAILLKWVDKNFVSTVTNFTFIGFEWLLHFQNNFMYAIFIAIAVVSLGVAFGYKYRLSIITLVLLWGICYFGQKTSYNNHYYLMWLVSVIMTFLPANAQFSIDAKLRPEIAKSYMPNWVRWVFIGQVTCVYFYATIAKFYPDWLDGTVTANMFSSMTKMPEQIQYLFKKKEFQLFIAYMGIVFDGLIVPALLWKRTRWFAIIASLIFHVFNSVTLEIGVFPYFALSFCIFFFPPEAVREFFFKNKEKIVYHEQTTEGRKVLFYFYVPYLILQLLLPIRHWFIKGDVLWTEEGHRLSWRMMLRARNGETHYKIVDKKTREILAFDNSILLTDKQRSRLNTPDVIWQMAQKIKSHFAKKNKDVAVYAIESYVTINSRPSYRLINPTVDLASEEWNHFKRHDWILEQNDPQEFHYDNHTNQIPVPLKPQK